MIENGWVLSFRSIFSSSRFSGEEPANKMIKTLSLLVLVAASVSSLDAPLQVRELANENNLETRQGSRCNRCNLRKALVCGADGLTYRNECLAVCQVSFLVDLSVHHRFSAH